MKRRWGIHGNIAIPLEEISVADMDALPDNIKNVLGIPIVYCSDGRIWPNPYGHIVMVQEL